MWNWIGVATKLLPVIISAVGTVEKIAVGIKGKDKQDAAVEIVRDVLPLVEASAGRDLVNDGAVQEAIRKVIDAQVALQNVIRDVAAKRAKAA